ncbi:hypothetical protein [Parapedobacter koreensis]|uniref:Cell division protein ZapB n=1 Tax=Parapedobacter koreensis TaxID=332977 RepID=A0A1H7RP63_9SPHI|nr:hypothetical protein [Parapedobacter koreensis]SEL61839.1 hypothetical protein SAMN05421740_107218 [Parapedobacter koreensis]
MQEIHTIQETGFESKPAEVRKDSTKIYFFVVAIVALLATNVYFYIKYKNTGDKVHELTDERVNMQAEIDRIEAELDRLTDENVVLSTSLKAAQDSVRTTIVELRTQLAQHNLTQEQLANAQQEISQLKQQVLKYLNEVGNLRNQNAQLTSERDELKQEVSSSSNRVAALEEENTDLTGKVRLAAALKVSGISINGVRDRSNNKQSVETKARRIDKFQINFTIADNPLAQIGMHDVYVRVIDPNGNLRTIDNGLFEVDGDQIQYTYKTAIDFANDGADYIIEWKDTKGFQKGTYTILLYADSTVMGQSSVVLK